MSGNHPRGGVRRVGDPVQVGAGEFQGSGQGGGDDRGGLVGGEFRRVGLDTEQRAESGHEFPGREPLRWNGSVCGGVGVEQNDPDVVTSGTE